jgi:Acetyltransferase (GNAT) domain
MRGSGVGLSRSMVTPEHNLPYLVPIDADTNSGGQVVAVRTTEGIERLRQCWTEWKGHPDSDIDVYLSQLKCRDDVIEPCVLVLFRKLHPVALLASRIVRKRLPVNIGYLRFLRPTVRALDVPYGGLRGDDSPENCRFLMDSIKKMLRAGHVEVATFDPIRVDSSLYAAARVSGLHIKVNRQYPMYHRRLDFPSSLAELHRQRPHMRHLRNNFANRLKASFGDVTVRCFRSPEQVDDFSSTAESIARTTYQRALGVGFSEESQQVRDFLHLAADRGWLRAYVLYAAGRQISFLIGTLYNNVVYLNFMGFDRTYERYWPGIYLLIRAAEDLCAEGVSSIDYGVGDAVYKDRFSNLAWLESQICMFRLSPKGVLLDLSRTVTRGVDGIVKQTLQKFGSLEHIKGLWRDHAARRLEHTP